MKLEHLIIMEDQSIYYFTTTYQTKLSEEFERIERFEDLRIEEFERKWENCERERESL